MSELQGLQTIKDELSELGVEVFAVSSNSVQDLKRNLKPKELGLILLSDPDLELIGPLGLRHERGDPINGVDISRPALLLTDANGVVIKEWYTDDWRVRPTPADILDWVKSLK
ncbi:MAG: redoxin domain-containing protein [Verrucomicrobiota bacterium]